MNMRLLSCLGLIFGAILVGGAQAQQRPGRVALVIGNAAYPDASIPLSTTIRDARTIAEELRRNEFEVDLKENLGKEDMQRALAAFRGTIRAGSTALFAFSGQDTRGEQGLSYSHAPEGVERIRSAAGRIQSRQYSGRDEPQGRKSKNC